MADFARHDAMFDCRQAEKKMAWTKESLPKKTTMVRPNSR